MLAARLTAAPTQQSACSAPPEQPGPGSAPCSLLTKLATLAAVITAALSSHTKTESRVLRAAVRSRCMRTHQIANRRRCRPVRSQQGQRAELHWREMHWTQREELVQAAFLL